MKEYTSERGAGRQGELELAKRKCLDKKKWGPLFCGNAFGDSS